MIAANSDEPELKTMTVTPDMAREWLGQNVRNRTVKWFKVDKYARDMANGWWQLTADAIRFGTDGRLLDGQNRLHAIIQADTPVRTVVATGLAPETQDAMDSGAARTAGDVLSMGGVVNGRGVAAAARVAMSLEQGQKMSGARFTNTEVQTWVFDNPEIAETAAVLGVESDARLIPLPAAIRRYCAYRLAMVDQGQAAEFFYQLATGVGVTPDSPILALRRRLGGEYSAARKISNEERVTAVFRAWNAWREGRTMAKVQTSSRTGVASIPEPI